MKTIRQTFSCIIIALSFATINAQNIETDSLRNLLKAHQARDTLTVLLLNKIAYKTYRLDIEKSLIYMQEAFVLADSLNYEKGKSESLRYIGIYYARKSNYPKALEYYKQSLELCRKIKDTSGISKLYSNMGIVYRSLGEHTKALEYYEKSISLKKELDDTKGLSITYNNLGVLYRHQGNYPKALLAYQNSLKLKEEAKDTAGIIRACNNIGTFYKIIGEYDKALQYFNKALTVDDISSSKNSVASLYNNIGEVHFKNKNYQAALASCEKSLEARKSQGNLNGMGLTYRVMGEIYSETGNYDKALLYLSNALDLSTKIGDRSLEANACLLHSKLFWRNREIEKAQKYSSKAYKIAKEIGALELQKEAAEIQAKSNEDLGNYNKACKFYVVFKQLSDSLYNAENVKKITSIEYQYKHEKEINEIALEQKRKDAIQAEKMKQQEITRNALALGFVLMTLLVIFILWSRVQKQKANRILTTQKKEIEIKNKALNQINEELNTTLDTIKQQKGEIEKQKTRAEEANKCITDSINYASRIQKAVLPDGEVIKKLLPEYFILYKPRDIVSGDFYWIQKINKRLIIAVADCTGHGVPGAFMSMLGISFLNDIVRKQKMQQTNHMLDELRKRTKETLDQRGYTKETKDGMDIALIAIDLETKELQFSGANCPLYIFRNNKLNEFKPDKQPIGIHTCEKPFSITNFALEKGDTIYSFSDGFADQLGGKKNRKFSIKSFKETLTHIQDKSMNEQKQLLNTTFNDWIGANNQLDDVLIFGIKIW